MTDFTKLKTLVLNADLTPMGMFPELFTVPARDAVQRVLSGSCSVVAEYDQFIKTPSIRMRWPSVIVRSLYQKMPTKVSLNRQNLWLAYDSACAFCGIELSPNDVTIDHLVPKARGGKDEWTNLVCSCWKCNQEKGATQHPKFKPSKPPKEPSFWQLLKARKKMPVVVHHESWVDFIPDWEGQIHVRKDFE